MAKGAFNLIVSDPPTCTVGFLPPSQWRSPADTRVVDTPDGLYCKLPQDSPIGVRGARNYPCMGHPGKRAPTVEICESDKPFKPLAMRQHVFGTYPLDPNLIAQGIPPDDRVNLNRERIFGPVEGTPLPPGAVPRGTPPGRGGTACGAAQPGGADGGGVAHSTDRRTVAPAAPPSTAAAPGTRRGAVSGAERVRTRWDAAGPSVSVAQYDAHTGSYVRPGWSGVSPVGSGNPTPRHPRRGRTCSPRKPRADAGKSVRPLTGKAFGRVASHPILSSRKGWSM